MNSITETFDIIAADGGNWIKDALCGSGDYDFDLWFPGPAEPLKAAKAIRICRSCPVRKQCLEDSLKRREVRGIRGGMSGNKRSRILRRRHEKAQPA